MTYHDLYEHYALLAARNTEHAIHMRSIQAHNYAEQIEMRAESYRQAAEKYRQWIAEDRQEAD